MRAQGGGHIINVSSVAGRRGLPLSGIYSATKFALNGLSEALRVEMQGSGIHVSIINPAATKSEFGESIRHGDVTKKFKAIGRVQTAEEVARSIVQCIKQPKAEVYPYGISRVLVEGGPSVARAFVDADMVDEAVIYQGPKGVGESGILPFVGDGLDRLTASGHFIEIEIRSFGPDRMSWWRLVERCSPALSAA